MQKITPSIWCAGTADDMAAFYAATLPDTHIVRSERYPTEGLLDFQQDMAGKTLSIELSIGGFRLDLLNAGDEFAPNPSISFTVDFDPASYGGEHAARAALDHAWIGLSESGRVLIPLGEYPYSPRYGWVQDRYGVSWQLMLAPESGRLRPSVVPTLTFSGPHQNQAADALDTYVELFGGQRATSAPYAEQTGPAAAGALMFGDAEIAGQWFAAMDAGTEQDVTFSEGISLIAQCADQDEIDRLWSVLSQHPDAEQCGWCRDAYGVSWQIVPENLTELLAAPGAFPAMLQMKKIVIADLHA